MYENGKQRNRYANKMAHKKKMKEVFLIAPYSWWPAASWNDYVAHRRDYQSEKYWKRSYLSGRRNYAFRLANKKLRSEFKQDKHNLDHDEISAPQNGNYRKYTDVAWIIY